MYASTLRTCLCRKSLRACLLNKSKYLISVLSNTLSSYPITESLIEATNVCWQTNQACNSTIANNKQPRKLLLLIFPYCTSIRWHKMKSLFFLYVGGLWFCCFLTGSQRENSEAQDHRRCHCQIISISLQCLSLCVWCLYFFLNYLREKRTYVKVCWCDLFMCLRLTVMYFQSNSSPRN